MSLSDCSCVSLSACSIGLSATMGQTAASGSEYLRLLLLVLLLNVYNNGEPVREAKQSYALAQPRTVLLPVVR